VLTDENLGIIIAATEEQGAEAVCYAIMNAALGAEPEDNLTVAVIRPCEVQIDR